MNRREFLKSAAIFGAAGSVLGGGKAFAPAA